MVKHYFFIATLAAIPFFSLSAYHGGGSYSGHINDRHWVDPNYYYFGAENGYYGGNDAIINDGDGVIIDPNAGSGAGMTDDSNALYQSYLNDFGVTH